MSGCHLPDRPERTLRQCTEEVLTALSIVKAEAVDGNSRKMVMMVVSLVLLLMNDEDEGMT